jgi:hypothetical protein
MHVRNGRSVRNGGNAKNGGNDTNGTKGTYLKGWIFLIVLCVLFSGLLPVDMHAAECENALARCMNDPYWHMTLAGPIYCAMGYLFCKKYIEG